MTEVTYLGYVHGTSAALKRMRTRNRGVIIHVGSGLAHRGIPLAAAYCGAKSAIFGFTEAVRMELLHDRSAVRVGIVEPSGVNTPLWDWCKTTLTRHPRAIGPMHQPGVVARIIVALAQNPRRTFMIGAPSIMAIVAERLAPHLVDRALGSFGYAAQQTSQPIDPRRPNNLWRPTSNPYAVRGSLRARAHSPTAWANRHRGWLAACVALTVAAMLRT